MKHNLKGNCQENEYNCDICTSDVLCDICHDHDEPRGECNSCDECHKCEAN